MQGLVEFDCAVPKHGTGYLHARDVHKLQIQDLGQLALPRFADELPVVFLYQARDDFPVLKVWVQVCNFLAFVDSTPMVGRLLDADSSLGV